ncbi:MAG: sterol desaturase family protein [Arcicella sp.]|nr:sterol desaturase family protein [Arcicella sp.]
MIESLFKLDFTQPIIFFTLCLVMFILITSRYFILGSIFHVYFYVWKREKWENRKINKREYPQNQFKKEVFWSMLTAIVFSVVGAISALAWQRGYTAIYLNINDYPLLWFPISIIVAMFIHETYYYWLHRLMHHPKIYKQVHQVHHDSKITSAWTAFSFHPIEGFLEALIMPVIIIIVPMHLYAILFHLSIMTITAAINHLDIEVYPRNLFGNLLGKHVIGATHHSHHHKFYRYNFGLYFTFWDKWIKTESPSFGRDFSTRGEKESQKKRGMEKEINGRL